MTLTIELSPIAERQFATTAAANGQSLQDYISARLEREAQEDAEDYAAAEAAYQDYQANGAMSYDEFRQELGL